MKKEEDLNEQTIFLEVDCKVIEKIRNGRLTCVVLDINESNQTFVLENVDGNLMLDIDKLPDTYHSCFLYNHGIFPYIIKKTLKVQINQ